MRPQRNVLTSRRSRLDLEASPKQQLSPQLSHFVHTLRIYHNMLCMITVLPTNSFYIPKTWLAVLLHLRVHSEQLSFQSGVRILEMHHHCLCFLLPSLHLTLLLFPRLYYAGVGAVRSCPKCHYVNPASKKRCLRCEEFIVGRHCPSCGTLNHNRTRECFKCSAVIEEGGKSGAYSQLESSSNQNLGFSMYPCLCILYLCVCICVLCCLPKVYILLVSWCFCLLSTGELTGVFPIHISLVCHLLVVCLFPWVIYTALIYCWCVYLLVQKEGSSELGTQRTVSLQSPLSLLISLLLHSGTPLSRACSLRSDTTLQATTSVSFELRTYT